MKWQTAKIGIFTLIPLFLLIPFSYHSNLLINGSITEGIVTGQRTVLINKFYTDVATYAEITFETSKGLFVFYGPDNYVLKEGTIVSVIYNPEEPTKCCLYNWFALYMNPLLIITFVLELLLFIGYWYLHYELKEKNLT